MTIYTYIRVQSTYHLKTMSIYNRLISPPFPSAAELVALDEDRICGWLSEVPSYFDDNAALPFGSEHAVGHDISKWRFRNLRIMMYRPFLIRWAQDASHCPASDTSAESLAITRCLGAAKETIISIQESWLSQKHTRLAAWYAL